MHGLPKFENFLLMRAADTGAAIFELREICYQLVRESDENAEFFLPREGRKTPIESIGRTVNAAWKGSFQDAMGMRWYRVSHQIGDQRTIGLRREGASDSVAVKTSPEASAAFPSHGKQVQIMTWPREITFDFGDGVKGLLHQANASGFVQLRRTASGGQSKEFGPGVPNAFKHRHYELFARLAYANIGVAVIQFDGENANLNLQLGLDLKAGASRQDIEGFVDELLRRLPAAKESQTGKGGSPHSPFRATLTSTSIEDVAAALKSQTGDAKAAKFAWHRFCSNAVLEGVPGTGKTYAINDLKTARLSAFGEGARPLNGVSTRFMTMHPSTSYEDFVEGLRPSGAWTNATAAKKVTDGKSTDPLPGPWFFHGSAPTAGEHLEPNSSEKPDLTAVKAAFALKNGFFVEACVAAVADPNKAVVVVLDELNRCNIPKVLGDLMTVIEESKRARWDGDAWVVDSDAKAVTLPYSGRKLFVPDNLFIVGTMNTTDRSVAPMDAALRRRFSFHRIWPQGFGDPATDGSARKDLLGRLRTQADNKHDEALTKSYGLWIAINTVLYSRYGADAMLGHSYLDDLSRALKRADATEVAKAVEYHWDHRILPQLMDVIASNGLTRSLVNDPKAFFGTSDKILDRIEVAVAGSGALRTAMLRLKEPNTLVKGQQNVGDQSKAPVPKDIANGDE